MIRSTSEFNQLALRAYNNPALSSIADFEADLKRFGYLNTALNRYACTNDLTKLRVALNHIIILSNVFGVAATVDMIRFKLVENISHVETMLYFLKMIESTDALDFELLNLLDTL